LPSQVLISGVDILSGKNRRLGHTNCLDSRLSVLAFRLDIMIDIAQQSTDQ